MLNLQFLLVVHALYNGLLQLPDGRIVEARMPAIVSASRRTDIPAFYADWFFDRLEKGYSLWTNPFNKQEFHVS